MTEETTEHNDSVGTDRVEDPLRSETVVKPEPKEPSRVVREAEHKLKEMSRKAKERKTAQNASR